MWHHIAVNVIRAGAFRSTAEPCHSELTGKLIRAVACHPRVDRGNIRQITLSGDSQVFADRGGLVAVGRREIQTCIFIRSSEVHDSACSLLAWPIQLPTAPSFPTLVFFKTALSES